MRVVAADLHETAPVGAAGLHLDAAVALAQDAGGRSVMGSPAGCVEASLIESLA